jgi:hypothetical protein
MQRVIGLYHEYSTSTRNTWNVAATARRDAQATGSHGDGEGSPSSLPCGGGLGGPIEENTNEEHVSLRRPTLGVSTATGRSRGRPENEMYDITVRAAS